MYICMYLCHFLTGSWLLYVDVCMYVCMYVCISLSDKVAMDRDCLMLILICIYVCVYVCISLPDMIMIVLCWCLFVYICMYAYHCLIGSSRIILVEEWLLMQVNGMKRFLVHEESSGKSSLTYLWGQYHVDMNWYYVITLCICLCFGQANAKRYISRMKTKWSVTC